MQACIASQYFLTVGISFLEKKFWKVSPRLLKKKLPFYIHRKSKTGKGFYDFFG